MSTITDNDKLREQLAPHLDQAVAALSESDRSAILLRFYERKSLREVGEQLGVSEEAAKKRVARALDKMREHLTRRGVVFGAIGLAGILTEQTVQAAPAALGVSVVKSATAGASVLPELVRETLEAWHLAKLKLAAGIAAVGVSICGVIFTANTLPKRQPPPSSSVPVAAAALRTAESTAKPQPAIATALPAQPVTDRVMQIRVVDQRTKQGLAEVQVLANIDEQKKTGRTDKDGLYELDLPVNNPSRFIIRVQQDRFVPMWAVWDVRDGVFRLPEQFTFTLDPSTSVGGVVLDEQGRPIAGATVSISLRGSQYGDGSIHINPWALKSAATDMLGRWRFDQAPADLSELEFRLTHPDYISTFYPGYPNNAKLSDAKLRDMTAEMEMKKGLSVAGAVFDVQGRPVAGAFVGLGESRSHVDFVNTMTDSTETFRFNNAKAGNRFLFVQANGYAPDLKRIEVGKDTGLFEFRLEPGHLIQGRVMDTQGNPISGVFVAASTWRGTQFLDWHTYTGTNGTFEWTDAPTDEVQFSFLKNEYRRLDKFALAPDSTNEVVTLQPPFIAHGSVTDAETGQPIASFRLALGRLFNGQVEPTWEGQNQRSFSDGQYEWNVRFSGRYLLRAEAEGYAPEISPPFDQAGEGFTHDFKLTRAAWIEGIVRKPDGQPAANTEVFLVVAGQAFMVENGRTEQGWEATPSRTDDNGHFRFSPTDKKFLVIALDDKGYAQAAFERMGPPIDLLLLPWARIEGEVRVGSRPAAGQKSAIVKPGATGA